MISNIYIYLNIYNSTHCLQSIFIIFSFDTISPKLCTPLYFGTTIPGYPVVLKIGTGNDVTDGSPCSDMFDVAGWWYDYKLVELA